MSFVHLHTHTEYSILDGANKIQRLHPESKRTRNECRRDHGSRSHVWRD